MRAVFGLLLVIWTLGGIAVAYVKGWPLIREVWGGTQIVLPDQAAVQSQVMTIFADTMILALLLWLGVLIMLAALMIAAPPRHANF